MKRIIKLTESDIRRIVERVINESDVKYNGISISPSKDGKGHLVLKYGDVQVDYKLNVTIKKFGISKSFSIAIKNIWIKDGKYYAIDNMNKIFKLDTDQLNQMVKAVKQKSHKFSFSGEGEIAGISGTYDATFTKV